MLARFGGDGMTILWMMVVAVYVTLAAMSLNLALRLEGRMSRAYLLFVAITVSTACVSLFELWIAHARSVEEFVLALRFGHIPLVAMLFAIPWFIRELFGSGRVWLALASNVAWAIALVPNFLSSHGRIFERVVELETASFLGSPVVTGALGEPHPLRWIGRVGTLLVIAFALDAAVGLWRRGGRRRVLVIVGSLAVATAASLGHAVLVESASAGTPYMISIFFLLVVGGMAYELTEEAGRAGVLAGRVESQAAELDEQEDRLRLAADAAELGFWSWTEGADAFWLTPRARSIAGLEGGVPVSPPRALAAVHRDDREHVRRTVETASAEGGEVVGEFRVVRGDGSVRWVEAEGAVELEGGAVRRARGFVRDITERRDAEAEMELQRLEVAHLSRALMLSELSSSLAHELKQPLTAILSNAQAALRFLARQPPDTEEVRGALEDIVEQDRYAQSVIAHLRDYLRKGGLETEPLEPAALVEEVLDLAKIELAYRRIEVITRLAPDAPPIRGDRVLLCQVLLNLVRNGTEAMDGCADWERRLTVRAEGREGGVELCVEDRGPGIPGTEREAIFQPFVTTRAEGLGLGLAVSRSIVEMHGGRIWAAGTADGTGAALHVFLPADPPPADVERS